MATDQEQEVETTQDNPPAETVAEVDPQAAETTPQDDAPPAPAESPADKPQWDLERQKAEQERANLRKEQERIEAEKADLETKRQELLAEQQRLNAQPPVTSQPAEAVDDVELQQADELLAKAAEVEDSDPYEAQKLNRQANQLLLKRVRRQDQILTQANREEAQWNDWARRNPTMDVTKAKTESKAAADQALREGFTGDGFQIRWKQLMEQALPKCAKTAPRQAAAPTSRPAGKPVPTQRPASGSTPAGTRPVPGNTGVRQDALDEAKIRADAAKLFNQVANR